jgi:hypothetical protein
MPGKRKGPIMVNDLVPEMPGEGKDEQTETIAVNQEVLPLQNHVNRFGKYLTRLV